MYLKQNAILQGGRYKIVKYISSGGFGCTYEAVFTALNKKVAIKEFFVKDFCNRDEVTSSVSVATQSKVEIVDKLKKKFIDEAAAIWNFNHPNIVRVTDVFEENGTAYYVMDYIDGLSLQAILKRKGSLRENVALKYIRQVADAMTYVHSLNRLHLDIKPGNIMIDEHDNAILIDFGASKQYNEQGENTSTLLGLNTIGYAPAEQMSRSFSEFNPAADVYALGATLYKLLTGVTPPDSVLLLAGVEELSPLPDGISSSTVNAVMQALKPKRTERTQTITEFLDNLASGQPEHPDEETIIAETDEETKIDNKGKHPKTPNTNKPAKPHINQPEKQPNYMLAILGAIGAMLLILLIFGGFNRCSPNKVEAAYDADSVAWDDSSAVMDSVYEEYPDTAAADSAWDGTTAATAAADTAAAD